MNCRTHSFAVISLLVEKIRKIAQEQNAKKKLKGRATFPLESYYYYYYYYLLSKGTDIRSFCVNKN